MNNEPSSPSSLPAQESAAPGGLGQQALPARQAVQNVAELRDLITQTQGARGPEAPRTYIWIPFDAQECAKVKENERTRLTLNESAQAHAEGTGVRQIAMDLRKQAGEDLTKPYTEAELCAAFNASDRQGELLERAARKSPAVIQTGVDNLRPPQKGDTVYILGHGRSDHEVLFGNHSDVRMNPGEVVKRMQENNISDDIAKLKLLSCGSHGQIHQGLAAACQEKGAYLDTQLTGYGFAKPGAPDTATLAPGQYSQHNSLNFSYIRDMQPEVPKLTANLNLGHVVTAIKQEFQEVVDFQPDMAELQANVNRLEAEYNNLNDRLNPYNRALEAEVLQQMMADADAARQAMSDFENGGGDDLDNDAWDAECGRLDEAKSRCANQVSRQEILMGEGKAMLAGKAPPYGLLDEVGETLRDAQQSLAAAQAKELRIQQKMGVEPGGLKEEAVVRKSTDAKVVGKVRDIMRPEPPPALSQPDLGQAVEGQDAADQKPEMEGYSAPSLSARAPAPPPPPPPKQGNPSTREQFKRGGGGGDAGGGPKLG